MTEVIKKLKNPSAMLMLAGVMVVLKAIMEVLAKQDMLKIDVLKESLGTLLFVFTALAALCIMAYAGMTYKTGMKKSGLLFVVAVCIIVAAVLGYEEVDIDNSELLLLITRVVETLSFIGLSFLTYQETKMSKHMIAYGALGLLTAGKGLVDKFVVDKDEVQEPLVNHGCCDRCLFRKFGFLPSKLSHMFPTLGIRCE